MSFFEPKGGIVMGVKSAERGLSWRIGTAKAFTPSSFFPVD
jgi:hypothetical protein